jgi:hypothetical protein
MFDTSTVLGVLLDRRSRSEDSLLELLEAPFETPLARFRTRLGAFFAHFLSTDGSYGDGPY